MKASGHYEIDRETGIVKFRNGEKGNVPPIGNIGEINYVDDLNVSESALSGIDKVTRAHTRSSMSTEEIKTLVRYLIEETNKGKTAALAVIDELYDPSIVFHCPLDKDIRGLEDYKQATEDTFEEIPDALSTIDDMIVEGDKVAMRITMTGTYTGKMGDSGSTNKKVTISMITIDRVAGGKFVEEWTRYDTHGFMQQLGLVT